MDIDHQDVSDEAACASGTISDVTGLSEGIMHLLLISSEEWTVRISLKNIHLLGKLTVILQAPSQW